MSTKQSLSAYTLEELKKIINSKYKDDEEYRNAIKERQRLYYIRNKDRIKKKSIERYYAKKNKPPTANSSTASSTAELCGRVPLTPELVSGANSP